MFTLSRQVTFPSSPKGIGDCLVTVSPDVHKEMPRRTVAAISKMHGHNRPPITSLTVRSELSISGAQTNVGSLRYFQRLSRVVVASDHGAPHETGDDRIERSNQESTPLQSIRTLFEVLGLFAIGTYLFECGLNTSLNEAYAMPLSSIGFGLVVYGFIFFFDSGFFRHWMPFVDRRLLGASSIELWQTLTQAIAPYVHPSFQP
jgi:hypothetical protein